MKQLPRCHERDPEVRKALEAARKAAAPLPVYVVGGYVRDLLLERRNVDIDLVVEGEAIPVARHLGKRLGVAVAAHPRFGTARLRLPGGITLDLATARAEQYPISAALPTVHPAPLLADLARRDFSINAMAARVTRHGFGPLIDPLGGYEDLRRGRIRVLHDRSFIDDPTRIFRAARFEARFGFAIARGTLRLLKAAVNQRAIHRLAGWRIFSELMLIGEEPLAPRIIRRLSKAGALSAIHPALAGLPVAFGLLERVRRALATLRMLSLPKSPSSGETYLLGMFAFLRPPSIAPVLRRLDPPARIAGKLTTDLDACRRTVRRLTHRVDLRQSWLAELLDPLSPEAKVVVLAALTGRSTREAVSTYLTTSWKIVPMLKGEDLRRLGFPPGPLYRKILGALRSAKLDGRLRTREDEMAFVRRRLTREPIQH